MDVESAHVEIIIVVMANSATAICVVCWPMIRKLFVNTFFFSSRKSVGITLASIGDIP